MLELNPERQLEDIRLIIKDLLKVVKVVSLYPESNPLPQNLRRSFTEKFESVIDDYGDIKLTVQKDSLTWADEMVFSGHDAEESLVSLLFDAGILTITFKSGLDVIEINRFLDIIKEGINTPGHDYDLVNHLWEEDLPSISLTTAEDIALAAYDGDLQIQEINLVGREKPGADELPDAFQQIFDTDASDFADSDEQYEVREADLADFDDSATYDSDGAPYQPSNDGSDGVPIVPGSAPWRGQKPNRRAPAGKTAVRTRPVSPNALHIPGANHEHLKTVEAAEAMGFTGPSESATPIPDTTVILNDQFQLSHEESDKVDALLDDDAEFDPWESTAELACEILHQEDEMTAFFETVGVVEKVVGELVHNARLSEADRVVSYLGQLKEKIKNERPLWSERLRDAIVATGSKERLVVLVNSLNNHPAITPNAIKRFLSRFGWESLGAITDMLSDLKHDAHREAVRTHLASLGGQNIQIISKGIYDKRNHVVKGAIQVLTSIADSSVIRHLQKAVQHKDPEIRMELVLALRDSPIKQSFELLTLLAQDKSADIRNQAVEIIVQRRGQAAFDSITELINSERFGSQSHEDRLALLIAYSRLGSEHAVEFLRKLATQYNPLFSRLIKSLRKEAFEALAHNQSERAARVLIRLTGSWRPSIKPLAIEAIQKRREIIYGGDDDNND